MTVSKKTASKRKVVIVAAGQPYTDVDYQACALEIEELFQSRMPRRYDIAIISSSEKALTLLQGKKGGAIIYLSMYFRREAERIVEEHGPRIKVVVYNIRHVSQKRHFILH